jgi:hypothetical protein
MERPHGRTPNTLSRSTPGAEPTYGAASESLRFADAAQTLFSDIGVQADFIYGSGAAIFIDGPHHDGEKQHEEDTQKRALLENRGIGVLVFRYDDNWKAIFEKWPGIFGSR